MIGKSFLPLVSGLPVWLNSIPARDWAFVPFENQVVRWSKGKSAVDIHGFFSTTTANLTAEDFCLSASQLDVESASQLDVDSASQHDVDSASQLDPCSPIIMRTCRPILRVPLLETWRRWMEFELALNGSGDGQMFWSVREANLIQTLLAETPFDETGRRRAYLTFNLTQAQQRKIDSHDKVNLCLGSPNSKLVASLSKVPTPDVQLSYATVPTLTRVFFDPGWRLSKTISGNNLSLSDRMSLKLDNCEGKIDEMAMLITEPSSWSSAKNDPPTILLPRALSAVAADRPHPYDEKLQFDIRYDGVARGDLTADWRKAAMFLRKIREQNDSPAAQRLKQRRNLQDETLRMALCYYADYSDPRGKPIGTAHFQLATTDAAEFVAVSIFVLLGLPVCCMWSIGCLGLKHKRLRNDKLRMRLWQQQDSIEQTLEAYLGYPSNYKRDEDEEESDVSPAKVN